MPPGIKKAWDDNSVWGQAQLIGYDQIRQYEKQKEDETLYQFLGGKVN